MNISMFGLSSKFVLSSLYHRLINKMALLQHGGVALFLLIYLYVWFKNYQRSIDYSEKYENTPAVEIMSQLNAGQWEMVGMCIIIFFVLVILMLTCFRALSKLTQGTPYDFTSMYISLSWATEDKLDFALQAGIIIPSILIVMLVIGMLFVRVAPVSKSSKKSRTELIYESIMTNQYAIVLASTPIVRTLLHGLIYITQKVILPFCPPDKAKCSLVRTSLLINLFTMAMVIILVYANFSFSGLRIVNQLMINRVPRKLYTLRDFQKEITENLQRK